LTFNESFIFSCNTLFYLWKYWMDFISINLSYIMQISKNMIDYSLFYVPLKNISLIWRRHHLQNLGLCSALMPLNREGSLLCHTFCDIGSRFFRSHPKDRPIQSPLTILMGMRRIYSNTDPHGAQRIFWRHRIYSACKRIMKNIGLFHNIYVLIY
jgi:hypothetical protein